MTTTATAEVRAPKCCPLASTSTGGTPLTESKKFLLCIHQTFPSLLSATPWFVANVSRFSINVYDTSFCSQGGLIVLDVTLELKDVLSGTIFMSPALGKNPKTSKLSSLVCVFAVL